MSTVAVLLGVPFLAGLIFQTTEFVRVVAVDLRPPVDQRQVDQELRSYVDIAPTKLLVVVSESQDPVPCRPVPSRRREGTDVPYCPVVAGVRPTIVLTSDTTPSLKDVLDPLYRGAAKYQRYGTRTALLDYDMSSGFSVEAAVVTAMLLIGAFLLVLILTERRPNRLPRPVPRLVPPAEPQRPPSLSSYGPVSDRPSMTEPIERPAPAYSVAERHVIPFTATREPRPDELRQYFEDHGWLARTLTHVAGSGGYVDVGGVVLWATAHTEIAPDAPVRLTVNDRDGGLIAAPTNRHQAASDKEPLR
ncbi:hypothetical protein [Actinocrispum wychmicini]|uniref:hypothetical protein n=1 Tax=Actinocrispum wychmicini TaxID=1213861 RepID=UPI0010464A5F|nr:hypothetical protein [Actinocrispum wychmicini]